MSRKEILAKKYVVRLSGEEREQLETLSWEGKEPGAARFESADPVEGRCLAGRVGLERQPYHTRPGLQPIDGLFRCVRRNTWRLL